MCVCVFVCMCVCVYVCMHVHIKGVLYLCARDIHNYNYVEYIVASKYKHRTRAQCFFPATWPKPIL